MKNPRCYYSAEIKDFLLSSTNEIIGVLTSNSTFSDTKLLQINAWKEEIEILKSELNELNEGRIIFEYIIPRMGKRIDVVILHKNIIFLLEFKCGEIEYTQTAVDQVLDYALDLQSFQKESRDKILIPILIATHAPSKVNKCLLKTSLAEPIFCNKDNIRENIDAIACNVSPAEFDYKTWENSEYLPTPTIIEAAQALYRGHNVKEITRNDAGAINLSLTTSALEKIIKNSKNNRKKSICFVTGVPGAGKTLVGLNLSIEHANENKDERAVFLSGNMPLVQVLQEALARDKVAQSIEKTSKQNALRSTACFIQIIHKYRDYFIGNNKLPPEKIVIFDEAQRAWTKEYISEFMKTKKGVANFDCSEPEFLISTMDRHNDWAVIICLVGGGQEINTGEAGLPEWFNSIKRRFKHWDVHVATQLNDSEYRRDHEWKELTSGLNVIENDNLHLSTSIRSYRSPDVADFVKSLLDNEKEKAKRLYAKFKHVYPILLTRNLHEAKMWVKKQSRGTTRYGLLASSGALRLKAEGIFVKSPTYINNWFLNNKFDVRSSYYLEDVATEFDIQGLEIDYAIVAWDADFRIANGQWSYHSFIGSRWCNIYDHNKKLFKKNAYRVLLTRARQGMVIFVPEGDDNDTTRLKEYYDQTYNFLREILT